MQKIISLFQRNYDGDRLVRDEVVPGAEWVPKGEGRATQKLDGTCCMIRDKRLYKRYTRKRGRTAPSAFEPATEVNPKTGKQEGWLPVGDGPDDAWHRMAFEAMSIGDAEDGTYELCGPKIQGNPEGLTDPALFRHGRILLPEPAPERTFGNIRSWLIGRDIEGIVWHHPDGRMVKIKAKDFGIKRGE